MSNIVTADDGTQIDMDKVLQNFTFTGTNLTSIAVTYPNRAVPNVLKTYVQTFTYTGSNIATISQWQVQP